jgi:hypothetical protein
MTAADRMTARHQRTYELCNAHGRRVHTTGSPATAARWLALSRTEANTWHVAPRLTVWFASERTDADDLERWHAELDRRHGL